MPVLILIWIFPLFLFFFWSLQSDLTFQFRVGIVYLHTRAYAYMQRNQYDMSATIELILHTVKGPDFLDEVFARQGLPT